MKYSEACKILKFLPLSGRAQAKNRPQPARPGPTDSNFYSCTTVYKLAGECLRRCRLPLHLPRRALGEQAAQSSCRRTMLLLLRRPVPMHHQAHHLLLPKPGHRHQQQIRPFQLQMLKLRLGLRAHGLLERVQDRVWTQSKEPAGLWGAELLPLQLGQDQVETMVGGEAWCPRMDR